MRHILLLQIEERMNCIQNNEDTGEHNINQKSKTPEINYLEVNSYWGKDEKKLNFSNFYDQKDGKSMMLDSPFICTKTNYDSNLIIQNTPMALRTVVKHLFSEENQNKIDNTPFVLWINEETDNLVINEDFISIYNRLLDFDTLDTNSEDKLINILLNESKDHIDLCDYATIKTNLILNWTYEYAKYLLSMPTKHKLFDMNLSSVSILQEYSDINTLIYTLWKSIKSLGFLWISRSMTLLNKIIEYQLSHTENKVWYIIEKSVNYSNNSTSLLNLESNVLIKITMITECMNHSDLFNSDFSNKWFLNEFYVVNYNSILSTRYQKMNMATQERIEFFNLLRNYVTLHPEIRRSINW